MTSLHGQPDHHRSARLRQEIDTEVTLSLHPAGKDRQWAEAVQERLLETAGGDLELALEVAREIRRRSESKARMGGAVWEVELAWAAWARRKTQPSPPPSR